MEQFRAYSPEDIILSNLAETSARHTAVFEQELAHLADLARELVQSQADSTELRSALPELRPTDPPLPPHLAQSREILSRLGLLHTAEQRLLLCREIQALLAGDVFSDPSEALPDQNRVAYQKSTFTDTAFLQLSGLLDAPRAVYTSSFPAACEEVFHESCDYCILPLENATEGRLVGFTRLIDRFGLKIRATVEVAGTGGDRSACFALLARQVLWSNTGDCRLEIAFQPTGGASPAQILLAAELCGLTLDRIHTIPQDDHTDLLHAVFSNVGPSLPAFLLYLSMEVPQHTVVGVYPRLTLQKK